MIFIKTIALYTRKSNITKQGDSIQNQITICKNYIRNKFPDEDFIFSTYEDEGFSGSNINRPKFKELLNDIAKKNFSILICYRLDRISRNVADFSNILRLLEKHNIAFISVKEQFDTTSPMGRAMMYISSVFAQLERETISERIKDNLLELAKTGHFLGGPPPFGFTIQKEYYQNADSIEKSFSILIPYSNELDIVNIIYSKFLEYRSLNQLVVFINTSHLRSHFIKDVTSIKIKRILSSPLYVKSSCRTHSYLKEISSHVFGVTNGNGYLTYNKKNNPPQNYIYAVSNHLGVIDDSIWIDVQEILKTKKSAKRLGSSRTPAILSNILKCSLCGNNMILKQGGLNKNGIPYYYYICSNHKIKTCINPSVRVDYADTLILEKLNAHNQSFFEELIPKNLKSLPQYSSNELHFLEKNLIQSKKKFNILLDKISSCTSEILSKSLLSKAENLSLKISNLETRIKYISSKDNTLLLKLQTKSYTSTKNLSKENPLKNLPFLRQRYIIQTLISSAYWDGTNSTISLKLKDNLSL